jgi:hypothetical protein
MDKSVGIIFPYSILTDITGSIIFVAARLMAFMFSNHYLWRDEINVILTVRQKYVTSPRPYLRFSQGTFLPHIILIGDRCILEVSCNYYRWADQFVIETVLIPAHYLQQYLLFLILNRAGFVYGLRTRLLLYSIPDKLIVKTNSHLLPLLLKHAVEMLLSVLQTYSAIILVLYYWNSFCLLHSINKQHSRTN